MAVTDTQNPTGGDTLHPLLVSYRRRVARGLRARYLGSSAVAVGIVWALAGLAFYMGAGHPALLPVCVALTVDLPLLALAAAIFRTPSLAQVARLLDRRLDNKQRMVTSLELMSEKHASPMTRAQLHSSTALLRSLDPNAVYPVPTSAPQYALGAGLIAFALGLFFLKQVANPVAPVQPGDLSMAAPTPGVVASPTAQSGLPNSAAAQPTPNPSSSQLSIGTDPAEAARKAEASNKAQQGLDRLKSALDEQSSTQGAADSLRQGDYNGAAKQLGELGTQNDQLSQAAKDGMAGSLNRAADDTTTAPDLQQAERNAAQALSGGDYNEINKAMKDLGDALTKTAGDVVPQQELAKGFPAQDPASGASGQQGQTGQDGQTSQATDPASGQQGQQGQQGQSGQSNQNGQSGQSGQQGQQGQQGQGAQSGQQGQSGNDQNGQSGQGQNSGGSDASKNPGQGEGSGAGKGDSRVSGPATTNLPNAQGDPFDLQGKGDPGQSQAGDPNGPPGLTLQGSGASAGQTLPAQQGGVVTAPSESNNVPVESWGMIQRYFSHDNQSTQSSPR